MIFGLTFYRLYLTPYFCCLQFMCMQTVIRNNWSLEEIYNIYYSPLLELVFKAASVHKKFNDNFLKINIFKFRICHRRKLANYLSHRNMITGGIAALHRAANQLIYITSNQILNFLFLMFVKVY